MTAPELKTVLEELEQAEKEVDRLRVAAARAALKLANGYVKRAAELLGWYRAKLVRLIADYPQLEETAKGLRKRDGWTGGRPKDDDT